MGQMRPEAKILVGCTCRLRVIPSAILPLPNIVIRCCRVLRLAPADLLHNRQILTSQLPLLPSTACLRDGHPQPPCFGFIMAERASKRRSARQLAGRKRSVYFEPDSDDAFEMGSESEGEQDYRPPRDQSPPPAPRPAKKRKQNRSHKPKTRSSAKRAPTVRHAGRKKKAHPFHKIPATPRKVKERSVAAFSGPSDGVTPPWTTLPLEILRDVFIFASQPIHDQTTTATCVNRITSNHPTFHS